MFSSNYVLLLASLLVSPALTAQPILTLQDAVERALVHNYSIQVSSYDTEITAKQVNPALVGRRPVVDFQGSYEFGWSDARLETLSFNPGDAGNTELNLDGISNDVLLGLEIRMNLLDGRAGKYRLDQLRTTSELSRLQLQQTIERTAYEVTVAYLEMARQQSLMEVTQQSMEVNQDRLERVSADAAYGNATSLDRLQIEVDLKTDSAAYRNLLLQLENARRNLNYLIGEAPEGAYLVDTDISFNEGLSYQELESEMLQRNSFLRLRNQNITLAEQGVELRKAAFRPTLQAYANLNFAYLQDDASFLQVNRGFGPNIGLRFNYLISDWGGRKIEKETAELEREKSEVARNSLREELIKDLSNAYATYRNTLEQLRIEESNAVIFERNLENMKNMFELGTATNTDVRAAQLNYNNAQNRIKNYQYTIKQAEVALYLLSGELTDRD